MSKKVSWKIENDAETLRNVEEIYGDKKRLKKAVKQLKRQAMHAVAAVDRSQ